MTNGTQRPGDQRSRPRLLRRLVITGAATAGLIAGGYCHLGCVLADPVAVCSVAV